jgi:RimJ/RimL family protein N-acetyltransferase
MLEINIREATFSDLDTLLEMEQGIIEAERPYDPTIRKIDTRYYDLGAMLNSPDIRLVVAENQEGIMGTGYARIDQARPFLLHEKQVYLGFMFILPAYRGQGINRLIIEDLLHWGHTRGHEEFRLEVYVDNTSAIRAYEKIGFQPYSLEMRWNSDTKAE